MTSQQQQIVGATRNQRSGKPDRLQHQTMKASHTCKAKQGFILSCPGQFKVNQGLEYYQDVFLLTGVYCYGNVCYRANLPQVR